MRVLITGCAGYIGSTLTPYLLRKGYRIKCIDWLLFGEDVISHVKNENNFEILKADVRKVDPSVIRDVDAVIDMAAIPNDPAGELNPKLTYEINFEARARTAKIAKKHGISRYILISSASIYGRQEGVVDETATPNPLTTYAKANLMAENAVLPLADKNYTVTVLRLSTVYGPSKRMRLDLVVNAMTYSAFTNGIIWVDGDGSQKRPLVHIVDVARAIDLILNEDKDLINKEIYNVGSNSQNYKILDIANIVTNIVGGQIKYRGSPDVRSYTLDFSKISKLGYKTLYTVEDGVKQIYHELLIGNLTYEDRWITLNWYKKYMPEVENL